MMRLLISRKSLYKITSKMECMTKVLLFVYKLYYKLKDIVGYYEKSENTIPKDHLYYLLH